MLLGILIALLSLLCLLAPAALGGGVAWLLVWPGLSGLALAAGYLGLGPRLLGKQEDGSLRPLGVALLAPFFLSSWALWWVQGALARKAWAHEVAPGVWVGRRPSPEHLPAGVRLVVDLTAEFPVHGEIRRQVPFACLATLDGTAPAAALLPALLDRIEAAGGPVYIHCAAGHGRSATVAALVLLRRGLARDVSEAEALMRAKRPGIRLTRSQRALVSALTESSAEPGPAAQTA